MTAVTVDRRLDSVEFRQGMASRRAGRADRRGADRAPARPVPAPLHLGRGRRPDPQGLCGARACQLLGAGLGLSDPRHQADHAVVLQAVDRWAPEIALVLTVAFTCAVVVAVALSPTHLRWPYLCAIAVLTIPVDPEVYAVSLLAFWWAGLLAGPGADVGRGSRRDMAACRLRGARRALVALDGAARGSVRAARTARAPAQRVHHRGARACSRRDPGARDLRLSPHRLCATDRSARHPGRD